MLVGSFSLYPKFEAPQTFKFHVAKYVHEPPVSRFPELQTLHPNIKDMDYILPEYAHGKKA